MKRPTELIIREYGHSPFWLGSKEYLVMSGDRFHAHLTFDEMLGVVARWSIADDKLCGMKTYEQEIECHRYMRREIGEPRYFGGFVPAEEIAGLLTYTPDIEPPGKADFLFNPAKVA